MDGQPRITEADAAPVALWQQVIIDLARMLRFYSRLPVPKLPFEADAHAPPEFTRAARMVPVAGWIIGILPALVLVMALALNLPALGACLISVATAVIITGAFHEDGLADTFDGLPGGATPERRLEIMKDSRIGSFGGAALMLSLMLRVTMLAALLPHVSIWTGTLVIAAAGLSRCFGLLPLSFLPAARSSGFSATAGVPSAPALTVAFALGLAGWIGAGLWLSLSLIHILLAPLVALALAAILTVWAKRAIGGQTGDIAGAAQQFAEIALLATLAAGVSYA
jgi:adenosylcobinamide-GDP ribazoletransferase